MFYFRGLIRLLINETLAHMLFYAYSCVVCYLLDTQLEEAITVYNYNKRYPLVRKKVSISTSTKKNKKVALFGENTAGSPVFATVQGYHDDGCVLLFHATVLPTRTSLANFFTNISRVAKG